MTDVLIKNEKSRTLLALISGGFFLAGGRCRNRGLLSHHQYEVAGDPVRQVGRLIGGWRANHDDLPGGQRYG